ncbi:MAG: TonB-dependent receptor [Pseudomonadota bacterium]
MRPMPMLATAGAAFVLSQAPLAQAQETEDNEDARRLQSVTVTAQKREQNILDVPISLTAVGGDQLLERGITDVGDLQFLAPGLDFAQGNTTRVSNFAIRGIGTSTFSDSIEGSVGIVVDGVVIGRAGGGLFDLADIERIEVLRGPQGTLFGKNASSGVLNIVTKRPSDAFEYNLNASYASLDEVKLAGSLSGPISDTVGLRLTGYSNTRDGQIDDVLSGLDYNGRDEWGLRGKAEFDFGASGNLLVIGDYSERDVLCCTWTTRSFPDGRPGSGLFGSGVSIVAGFQTGLGITPGPDNEFVALSGSMRSTGETWGVSGEYSRDIGDLVLTSITAYRDWSQADNNDADQTTFNILDQNFGDASQDQFTQELRLSSAADGQLVWTIGAFYFDQTVRTDSFQSGTFGLDLLGATPPGTVLGRVLSIRPETTNYAVFGDATYSITDRFRLLGGLRVQREELDVDFIRTANDALTPLVLGPSWADFTDSFSVEDDAVTWRIGAQYDVTDNSVAYATVTRGYKGPGVNTNVDTVGLAEVSPEIPTSFEIGSKSILADGRVGLNAAVFYTTFEDFQAESFVVPDDGGPASFDITNAGELETYGLEADVSAQLTENWFVSAGVALIEATYSDFEGAACFVFQTEAEGCIGGAQDLSGAELPNSSDVTLNATTTYDTPVLNGRFNAFISGSGFYRSDFVTAQDQDPNTELDGYALLDLSIGVRDSEDRWGITIFGKNVTAEDFVESVIDTPFDSGGYSQFLTPASESIVGIRLDLRN